VDQFNLAMKSINPYDAFGNCYTTPSDLTSAMKHPLFKGMNDEKNFFNAGDYTPFLKQSLGEVPPCVYAKPVLDYLNNQTVRAQLNIPADIQKWDLCQDDINYTTDSAGSIQVYRNLKDKYRILKYSGDTDMVVSTYGTKGWIQNENWPIQNPWKQYFVGD